ncbi:MAG: response regulator [Deltaproteobacteria bacterium]|nr:response regulator [Deltaproteobacteria bacterium]
MASTATILCADDDRGFCQILSRAFTHAGYQVETAHDGYDALERAMKLKPALLTLDVMLPRMDGFRVLEMIRSEKSLAKTPVMFVSGCTFTPDYEARAKALAATAVLKKPVPLDQLLAAVESAMAMSPAKPRGALTLDGSLEQLPFAELLHHLHGLRATGVLDLKHGKKKKQLQLKDGVPEAVRSNLMQETLGALLVASGTITEDVLHACVSRMKTSGGLIGQILLASQMLDEENLTRALRRQADEKFFELFGWRAGSFVFHQRARLKGANALYLNRSPADLLLHGVLERMPRDVIEARLAHRNQAVPVPGGSRFYQFQSAQLDAQGRALLGQVDGVKTVAQIEASSERARRLLYALIALEIVELAEAPAGSPPAKQPKAAPANAALREVRRTSAPDPRADRTTEQALRTELSGLAERLRSGDPWRVLGVGQEAGDEHIRAVYAELAKRVHPDRCVGASDATRRLAEELFGFVTKAFDAIRDDAARVDWRRQQRQEQEDAVAREESERAVYAESEFTRGEGLLRAKRPSEALQAFRNAVESYPDECDYHVYLGWAHYMTAPEAEGRVDQAIAMVMRGRKIAPDRRTPYLFLARLSQAAGRIDHAEKMYARAIQIDPGCVEAMRELRLVRMRQDKSKGIVGKILRR